MIEILDKGFLTMPVSDTRHGLERYGVPGGGPMDCCSYTLANRLVGNADHAVALEATMVIPRIRFCDDRAFAIVGGQCETALRRNGQSLPVAEGETVFAKAGDELTGGALQTGCRAYLAVAGGIRDTSIRTQPLHTGDRLELGDNTAISRMSIQKMPFTMPGREVTLRVIEGVHTRQFSPEGLKAFYGSDYIYTPQSDRMGIRLHGAAITFASGSDGNIISEGMMPGDIQVTSSGQPILMMADCQTVGGYAKIGHVISADLPIAAQLRPGARIRFKEVLLPEAQAAWRKLWYQMECHLQGKGKSDHAERE